MGASTTAVRLGAGAALLAMLAGCSVTGAAPSSAPATEPPTAAPTQAETPAATSAATVTRTWNVAYEAASDVLVPGTLDIVAPERSGPWPVVVMLHGNPAAVSKGSLDEHARRVAEQGFVVFNAAWGHPVGDSMSSDQPVGDLMPSDLYAYATATNAQTACAIAFARANAAAHGGDPSRIIVFGHSGGSNTGSVVVFGDVAPSSGCLGGSEAAPIDALVTWEGDFLAAPEFDQVLAAEPRFFDQLTPWAYLADKPALPVYMLLSENPGPSVEMPFTVADLPAFLALRDKDGTIGRLMEETGAIEDGIFSVADEQHALYEALRELGNPVSLDVMPGSTHTYLSEEGWKVFLAAFRDAAGGG